MNQVYLKGKAIVQPNLLSKKYERFVLSILKNTKVLISKILVLKLPSLYKQNQNIRKDDYIDDIESVVAEIDAILSTQNVLLFKSLENQAAQVLQFTTKKVFNSISDLITILKPQQMLGVDIFESVFNKSLVDISKSWAYTNARLITSLNETLLNDVANIIQTGFRSGSSLTSISQEIQKKFNISTNKAKFLAQDQTAKLHSDYILDELRKFNISTYVWSTSNDERVRTSHKVLNNRICSIDNEEIYKNTSSDKRWLKKSSIGAVEKQAGQDYRCRCVIIPLVKAKS